MEKHNEEEEQRQVEVTGRSHYSSCGLYGLLNSRNHMSCIQPNIDPTKTQEPETVRR